ncbi:MAG: ribulose-phosphate 3-epimerase [Muribaculaceae bacterium]|nr:ribulose-phosphate 3-epimerase [Muribaculaceae bacterium]MDE7154803.1 ribulose-phosphate 3-epimerase [Muribaculaceae bacterium]
MIIAPSILSADFANLAKDIEMVNQSDADWFHIDVMDGVFVPNISFGFPVIKAIQKYAKKPLDVHLMIVDPDRYIGAVRDCGAEIMNIHQEASTHLHRSLQAIKAAGMKAGVTLNPATPLVMIEEIIEDADVIMLMGVNPGFGGQSFINATVDKMKRLREMVDKLENPPLLEIDGGVNATTAPLLRDAGADILVAGSYVFSSSDPTDTIKKLKQL